jgi:hypothetical protein
MAKRPGRQSRKSSVSRHQKDLEELKKARFGWTEKTDSRLGVNQTNRRQEGKIAVEVKETDNKARSSKEYTFNWSGDSATVLVPNLNDLPPATLEPLRRLIICTAKGEETPGELKDQLMTYSGKEIIEAIIEGIHRWHTYGKERG